MLSGEFASVPLSSVSIDREGRQRRELTGVEELAESIRNRGLMHPPIVTRELVLVAGERRMAAAALLGWTDIMVQWVDTVEEIELKAIELEENIKRVDITWQDRTAAVEAYHKLQLARDPEWTQESTAEALGITQRHVARNIAVATAMKADPKVAKASAFSAAHNLVMRTNERQAAAQALNLSSILKRPDLIETADFCEWVQTYDGPKFNFIHCDFPYGINMDKTSQGVHHTTMESYEDSPETFFKLCRAFVKYRENFIAESAHVMFWFHMNFYQTSVKYLEAAGFTVNPMPLIWLKSDNTGIISDPNRRPRHIYETALLGAIGDRKLVRPKSDAVALPTVANTFHISNKPLNVLQYFFEQLVDNTTSMLDPTAGSGGALKVAKGLQAAHVHGLEINPEIAQAANQWVNS